MAKVAVRKRGCTDKTLVTFNVHKDAYEQVREMSRRSGQTMVTLFDRMVEFYAERFEAADKVTLTFNECLDLLRDYGIRGNYETTRKRIERGEIPGASVIKPELEGDRHKFLILRRPVVEWLESLRG